MDEHRSGHYCFLHAKTSISCGSLDNTLYGWGRQNKNKGDTTCKSGSGGTFIEQIRLATILD